MTTRRRALKLPSAPPDTATLYVRLSREAAAENLSRDGMLDDVRGLASSLGLRVVGEHVDDGLSGAIRNRPEFVAWLDDVREERAAVAIAWHVDRMTREGVNVAALILDAVEGKDPTTGAVVRQPARLLDCKGLDSAGDETSFRIRFVIAAEIARAERERMKDRQRAAKARARVAGRFHGGSPPFGWKAARDADGGAVLVVAHEEAEVIREAARKVLAGGRLFAVVRWMNGPNGAAPRRAKDWTRVTLRQVLTVTPAAAAEDVLEPEERAALRRILSVKHPDARKGGRQPSRLLSGLLRCHGCMHVLYVARKSDGSVTYRCQTGKESGRCARPVAISAVAVEEFIARDFLTRDGDKPEMVRRASISGAAALEAAEEAVEASLAALGTSPTPEAFAALQQAHAQRELAQQVTRVTEVSLVATGRSIADAWHAMDDVADRRALLAANYADIIVMPGRRGPRGIDPRRLLIVASAPHTTAQDAGAMREGRVVVE